ncbi:uncharacterized protein [Typha latifolia]|uniref:uncharacterized protein isoform X4 n=1 Tax=Typha latifolia TaxID=4733 RepID=UPI003C2F6EFA
MNFNASIVHKVNLIEEFLSEFLTLVLSHSNTLHVEYLAKKYEDKYKQVGDVASKLTIEEATFCDIQEKMLELCNAIIKMQKSRSPGDLLQIQSNLEELVKSPNEQCKHYGLRAKPTSLIELPFERKFKKKAMIVGTTELHTPSQELLYYFASTFFPGEPI